RPAALAFHLADGRRSVEEIAAILRQRLGEGTDDAIGPLALLELDRAGLLAQPLPADLPVTRRDLIKAAAYLLPIVASITIGSPALHASGTGAWPGKTLVGTWDMTFDSTGRGGETLV